MPEDPGGQTSTLKATKSAPLGPHPGAAPLPPPGLGVIKPDRGRGSSPGTTPSLRAPSSPGWGTHTTGLPDVRGSQEIQGGPPPQSTFRKGHLLRSPSPPRGNLGPPRCGRPASVALSGAVTQRHAFKIRLCFTHSSLWPSRLRCVPAPRTACPRVCRHWVASPFGCSKSGCCERSGKCLDVDPHFSWSRTREWNCWFLGNVVLSRLTGAASSISFFT